MDTSFLETVNLVFRPFTEEFDENWRVIRGFCLVFFMITLVLWLGSYFAPSPRFDRPKQILDACGWITFFGFVVSYGACCYRVRLNDKERENEKIRRVSGFQD